MMTRTVLRLSPRRRAISRASIPSWWSRKTALRLSAAIMQLPQGLEKGRRPAQEAPRQEMGLRVKGPAGQPGVLAFAHDPLHVLLRHLQVAQEHPLELVAGLRAPRRLPHPFQREGQIAPANLLAKRLRPAEVAMSQLFDLPHTQPPSADRHHKLLDLRRAHAVHAPELAQGVHV